MSTNTCPERARRGQPRAHVRHVRPVAPYGAVYPLVAPGYVFGAKSLLGAFAGILGA